MSLKSYSQKILTGIGRLTGTYIRLKEFLPVGVDLERDIGHLLPRTEINVIFDVGANVGQSAKAFCRSFPNASIFSFEPIDETYRTLKNELRNHPSVRCFNLAISDSSNSLTMKTGETSLMSRITDESNAAQNTQTVPAQTIDDFCIEHGIRNISLLKVDTEGHDLKVLSGASDMLRDQSIDIVDVELGMSYRNDYHAPFDFAKSWLEDQEYVLFAVYEQRNEWIRREPHLRRTNAVFISTKTIEVNRGS